MANGRDKNLVEQHYCFLLAGKIDSGKSALQKQFCHNKFIPNYRPALSVLDSKVITSNNVKTNVWVDDLPGRKIQYKGEYTEKNFQNAQIVLLVFDLTDIDSFNEVEYWKNRATSINPKVVFALVGNKADLVDQRKVSPEVIKQKGQELGIRDSFCFEVSAKNNIGIEQLFSSMTDVIRPMTANELSNQVSPPKLVENTKTDSPSFFSRHKRKIVIALAALVIAAIIVIPSIILWPAIISLPFIVSAGAAIASLGIGLTAPTAAATITGISISLIGGGIVAGGSWLIDKLFQLFKCGETGKVPANDPPKPIDTSTPTIFSDLNIDNINPVQQPKPTPNKHSDIKPEPHSIKTPDLADVEQPKSETSPRI